VGREDQLHYRRGVQRAAARSCAQYLRKGSRVVVDAELDSREWTDQHDSKREAVTLKGPAGGV
jgi:single-stranded DNA-binding protein